MPVIRPEIDLRINHSLHSCSYIGHPSEPVQNSTGRQLVCNNVELLGETPDERIHRLAIRDAERREQLRQELEQLHHKDWENHC